MTNDYSSYDEDISYDYAQTTNDWKEDNYSYAFDSNEENTEFNGVQ